MLIALLLFLSFGAAFIQRVSGFGFGIFIMTVLPFVMPSYGEATTLSGMLASVTSVVIVARTWRHICWPRLLPILLTFLLVSFLAVGLVSRTDDTLLRRVLGVILIVASLWFAFLKERFRLRPTLGVQVSMGSLSGLMGGLFAMQGPPAVLYFVSTNSTKEAYIAMAQTYFLVGNIAMTLFRARCGFLSPAVVHEWVVCIPAVVAGTWCGAYVFNRMSLPLLRNIIYVYMAITGILALCR